MNSCVFGTCGKLDLPDEDDDRELGFESHLEGYHRLAPKLAKYLTSLQVGKWKVAKESIATYQRLYIAIPSLSRQESLDWRKHAKTSKAQRKVTDAAKHLNVKDTVSTATMLSFLALQDPPSKIQRVVIAYAWAWQKKKRAGKATVTMDDILLEYEY
ncbi:hypothetical protein HDU79_000578 [Rhizoclosmatium sp. JEL0117]|nr:hypothetical protein HDU79_003486 [Rhizoclosmatium sp. JEL0117]KAJ3293209.1 hypothetical protein HDU79_000578 [Rhizoclosmatium sp. JEL0117]